MLNHLDIRNNQAAVDGADLSLSRMTGKSISGFSLTNRHRKHTMSYARIVFYEGSFTITSHIFWIKKQQPPGLKNDLHGKNTTAKSPSYLETLNLDYRFFDVDVFTCGGQLPRPVVSDQWHTCSVTLVCNLKGVLECSSH